MERKIYFSILLALFTLLQNDGIAQVTQQRWSAAELWSSSVSRNLTLDGNSIVPDRNVLIENDAATLGSIRSDAWDTIGPGIRFRKHLNIGNWPVDGALITMLLYPLQPAGPMTGSKIEVRVNGNPPITYEVRHFWTSIPVPNDYLRSGDNMIEVSTQGTDRFRIPIASNAKNNDTSISKMRSERSVDGKTWVALKSNRQGSSSAEYPIRLKLKANNTKGWLQTSVIALSGKGSGGGITSPVILQSAKILLDTLHTGGSKWQARARTGNTHVPEAGGWTNWVNFEGDLLPVGVNHRFVQLEFTFEANSLKSPPEIRGLTVNSLSRPAGPEFKSKLTVMELKNNPMIRSSFNFAHEDPSFSKLQEFRKTFGLDKVVEGAATEFEKMKRLRGWAASRWDWYLPHSELEDLLTWDASKILSTHPENGAAQKIGGNCLHYAIVLAQACQSFGIPARIVNTNYSIWGGHELVEVWSRDFEKWIMLDPNFDTSFYDRKTGIPLNILELHHIFLDTYYPGKEVVNRDTWSVADRDRRSAQIKPELLPIGMEAGGRAYSGKIDKDYVWWKVTFNESNPGYSGGYGFFNTAEVRWVPRSNWLSQPQPLPVTHGRTHWGWDGYLAWTDPQTPETPEHRNFVRRASDLYGNLFLVDFSAERVSESSLKINMATDSPGFKHFELLENGRKVISSGSSYTWNLLPGANTLELRSVDVLGNRGGPSKLKINYTPGPH
jgi:hypothetical protein